MGETPMPRVIQSPHFGFQDDSRNRFRFFVQYFPIQKRKKKARIPQDPGFSVVRTAVVSFHLPSCVGSRVYRRNRTLR
jgi:hypothetical protein